MRKVIAAINMILDGSCDHTTGIPDEELHQHYTALLDSAGAILYGRITYQLMESYWPGVVKKPTGIKPIDDFALAMERIPKIVFSHTLKSVQWKSATLAMHGVKEEVLKLKQQPGNDILVGSPSVIVALTNLNLIDEYQLCIHPVIASGSLLLFKNIHDRIVLKLLKTKTFNSSSIILYYDSKVK